MKTKEQLKKDTANVLKNLRIQAAKEVGFRLTQADVANDASLSVRHYNDLENARKLATIDTLMKIAYSYKITLAELCKLIEEY